MQEFYFLIESVVCGSSYSVLVLSVVSVVLDRYVGGGQVLESTGYVEPDGCGCFVNFSFQVLECEKFFCLSGISKFDVRVTVHRRQYKINNQLDATKCWFIFSTCFEHYYAHLQEYISEYRFLVSKPGKYE
jgi:hypothetical protein